MENFTEGMNNVLEVINTVLWHPWALIVVLIIGVLFTLWSGFSQYRALTTGVSITLGLKDKGGAGAISHFQALSAALSATVGIGNIGGVAVAVALGGPGAIFWMWVVGIVGMALKTTEVTLAMLYRNVDDPDNPHGGAMWVADKGMSQMGLSFLGKIVAIIFCITLLISTITGGNMFQAWNVAEVTAINFPDLNVITDACLDVLPTSVQPQARPYIHVRALSGLVLAILCALVIVGGIKRIGNVAGKLVPFMCVAYLVAACVILAGYVTEIPGYFRLIVTSAFQPAEASQAFLGGTMGYAFLWGLKRAFFSSEAGQGSSPIAHCAVKTDEPVSEGLVAGLEPFIDTLIVCTITSLVILATGTWNRKAESDTFTPPAIVATDDGKWTCKDCSPPPRTVGEWKKGDKVFLVIRGQDNPETNANLHRLTGEIKEKQDRLVIVWDKHEGEEKPVVHENRLYANYAGAALTSHAFDHDYQGLGRWLVTLAVWLFALSTLISWSYYGEQGMIYLLGDRSVMPYRIGYCVIILVSTMGFIDTDRELDNLSALGTGVMLFANLPICLLFGSQTMRAYWGYIRGARSV